VWPDVTRQDTTATGVDYAGRPAFDGEALFAAAEHDVASEVIELDTARYEGLLTVRPGRARRPGGRSVIALGPPATAARLAARRAP
jgi:hypothetical protein